jgi:hypothetical protein
MDFHRAAAAIMIARAINMGHAAFGIQSKVTENFEAWMNEHIDEIFERQSPAPSVESPARPRAPVTSKHRHRHRRLAGNLRLAAGRRQTARDGLFVFWLYGQLVRRGC